MDSVPVTANLTMLRVNGWQLYVWREGDSATLIDTGAPGSGTEIAAAVPGLDRIVLTHGHVDHCGSAAELRASTGAPVLAGAGDAAVIRGEATMPPPVLEDWERPILERVSADLPNFAPPVPVDQEHHLTFDGCPTAATAPRSRCPWCAAAGSARLARTTR